MEFTSSLAAQVQIFSSEKSCRLVLAGLDEFGAVQNRACFLQLAAGDGKS
ncbi:MAG: hypothetical protein WCD63_11015 [Terrimicrobiaceae bacterium]